VLRGGERDFDTFVALRSASLYRTAVLLAGGDTAAAADAVQNTMVELWRRWHRVRSMERADGYAHRVLVTQVLRGRRGSVQLVPTADVPEQPVGDLTDATNSRRDMWGVVRTLPAVQRAVVVLRFYEDLTEAQTADALGIAVGTVKSHTSRALTTLRRQLGNEIAAGGARD
jgi:RNA polymerase sigma-70 factor (sigma-E family)